MKLRSYSFIFFLFVTLTLFYVSSCQESDYESEDEEGNDGPPQDTVSVSPPTVVKSSTTTRTTTTTSKEDEEDEDENLPEAADLPYAAEGESLSKLQSFLLSSVENVLKQALPTIVRSGLETNVSSSCSSSFLSILNALRESQLWAYRMLDASGKPPSGILDGTLTDLGSFEECLEVKSVGNISEFTGRYCLMDVRAAFDQNIPLGIAPPPGIKTTDLVWHPALQIFWSRNHLLSFRYGACIPSTCSKEDFQELAGFLAEPTGMEVDVHSCQMTQPWSVDNTQLSIIIAFVAIFILVLSGTVTEYMCIVRNESIDGIDPDQKSLRHFITRFSIHRNTTKLLQTTNQSTGSTLRHLDGIRFFTVAWIILGHTYFFTDIVHYTHYRRIKQVVDVDDHIWIMPLANFTLSVNTFFFISGLLLIFSNWKKMKVNSGKIDVVDFFIHRTWRIWPAYLATIGLAIVLPLIGSGPMWPQAVESTATLCRNSWWYNILFINNFQKSDELCLYHTWYMSAAMQFHVMGGILLYLIYRSAKWGIISSVILMILSSIASYWYAYTNDIRIPSVIAYEVFADSEQKILQLYMMPYNHFGSYLSGILVGFFLMKHQDKEIPRYLQAILWIVSAITGLLVLCGPHEAYKAIYPSVEESSLYYAFARTAWSWAIGWMIFACSTGRGGPLTTLLSWPAFGPLSSLSYLAYLTHPILMFFHTGRIRERIYFGHYEMICIFLSRLIMTFFLAYFVHVMIEVPFASIESYIFLKKPKNQKVVSSSKKCHKIVHEVTRTKTNVNIIRIRSIDNGDKLPCTSTAVTRTDCSA